MVLLYGVMAVPQTKAQSVANYGVVRNTSVSYSSIYSTSSAVNSWRNVTGTFQQDDNRSYFVPIGFDFWYNGVRYTQLSVSTNGFIDFSTSTDNGDATADDFGYVNSAFSASTAGLATRPACALFYDDLTAQGGSAALGNSIRYRLSGTAPSRTLTIEWINMAVYGNTTPSLNFQIVLTENTGRITYNYGTMTNGTHGFSYTLGLNAPTVSAAPTAAELKNQTTANSTTFSNTPQNNLNTIPASNSQLIFTPPVPANPTGSLTFSAITQTSMTLNWTNWASNEVGYVIYNSTDGTTFTYVTQTAVNATNSNITGLLPGTTYFWRVYAVTEGALSSALSGSQITNAAGNKVSNTVSGNWNNAGNWLPAGVPTAADNVTILNGHTITINTDAVCNNLTVGQGTSGVLRIGNNGTARSITVANNIQINSGAQFITNTASNATHTISVVGNIVNNGTLNFASDANSLCNATFSKNGNQSISGTGATTNFNLMTLNMGTTENNVLTVGGTNFSAPSDFLTLINGTFYLANSASTTLTLSTAATYIIESTAGFRLNNSNAVVTLSNNLELIGILRVDAGTFTVGNASNETLTSNGGELTITGGTLNVAGRYVSSTINNLSRFTMSGGTMLVPTQGSTSTTAAPWNITSAGSVVNISGGTIIIQREGGSGAQNLGFTISNVINSSVTGGVLQIGNASTPAAQTMRINTVLDIGNLHVLSANATAQQAVGLNILQNVNIFSGIFDANNLSTSVGGNWTDNGNFLPGTGTVTLDGTGTQIITDPSGETFNNVVCAGPGTVLLANNIDVNNDLSISSGATLDVGASNNYIQLQGDWSCDGSFEPQQGVVEFNGTVLQTLSNSVTNRFYDLTTNNSSGVSITSGTYEVQDAYTPVAGNFNVTGATSFTLLSDASSTARIEQAGTGTVTGNFNVQRFIAARSAGYSDMASPVTSTTINDWDSELLLVYAYSPPYSYPSAYSYDETMWDYVPVTSSSEVLTPGKGFEVYLDSDGSYTSFNNTTLDTRGTPFIGTLNISADISFVNDGWNLVGNPYASFVSWDDLLATTTGINSDIMIYDEVTNDFELISGGTGFEIAPHQGFWIEANSTSPNFVFTEPVKTSSSNSTFKAKQESNFSLVLKYANRPDFFTSKTQFTSSLTNKNIEFKTVPHPLAPRLYSIDDTDKKFRRFTVDYSKNELELPLGFNVGESGLYTISAQNLFKLTEQGYTCIRLVDTKTGGEYLLQENKLFTFYADEKDAERRFKLVASKTIQCLNEKDEWSQVAVDFRDGLNTVDVLVNATNLVPAQISVIDFLGQSVPASVLNTGEGQFRVMMNGSSAYYIVQVTVNNKVYTHKYFVR